MASADIYGVATGVTSPFQSSDTKQSSFTTGELKKMSPMGMAPPLFSQWPARIWPLSQKPALFGHVNLINLRYQFQQDRNEDLRTWSPRAETQAGTSQALALSQYI